MAPDLSDLLTELLLPAEASASAADRGWKRFVAFLQNRGIEYCNFGAFETDAHGETTAAMMVSNMDPAWIEEYLACDMPGRDYVALRAANETGGERFASFAFGGWLVPHLAEHETLSRPVLRGAADAGMADALAIVGNAPAAPDSPVRRQVGFGLGGAHGSALLAEDQRNELTIAAFALINAMRPRIAASFDGFAGRLSPRERDVLAAFARGDRRDRIAHRLGIAHQTVDLHGANLRRKLGAQTIAEAVAKAFRYGLL